MKAADPARPFALHAVMLVLCFCISIAGVQAGAHPNRPARVEAGSVPELEAKRAQLFKVMMDDPSDLDAAFEYAALSSQLGDLEGAIATLERMLIFAPGLPRLQLELGVLYFRLGAYGTAKTYFDAALAAPGVPKEVVEKVQRYQLAAERKAGTSAITGAFGAGVQYQTNANNGPADATVTLNGLNYLLSRNARATPDVNAYLTGDLEGLFDLPEQGVMLRSVIRSYAAIQRTRGDLSFGYAEMHLGPSIDLNRFEWQGATLDLYGIAGGGLLAGFPLMTSAGAGALLTLGADDIFSYGLRGEYRTQTFYNSLANPNLSLSSGTLYDGLATITYRPMPGLEIRAGILGALFEAQAAFNAYRQAGGLAGLSYEFASPVSALPGFWNVVATTQLSYRQYDGPDPMISQASQVTTTWTNTLTATLPRSDVWAAIAQAGYQQAVSNYAISRFQNFSVSLGVKRGF